MNNGSNYNKRSFVSICLVLSFSGLPVSGYFNHLLAFDGMSVQKHVWMSVHNMLGLLCVVFSVWHIVLNRKVLLSYFKRVNGIIKTREALHAAILVCGLLALIVMHALHAGG